MAAHCCIFWLHTAVFKTIELFRWQRCRPLHSLGCFCWLVDCLHVTHIRILLKSFSLFLWKLQGFEQQQQQYSHTPYHRALLGRGCATSRRVANTGFYHTIVHSKSKAGMVNRVDLDVFGQSGLSVRILRTFTFWKAVKIHKKSLLKGKLANFLLCKRSAWLVYNHSHLPLLQLFQIGLLAYWLIFIWLTASKKKNEWKQILKLHKARFCFLCSILM